MSLGNEPQKPERTRANQAPDSNSQEDLAAPLSPELARINSVQDKIKRCREVLIVIDHKVLDEDGLGRTVILAPRASKILARSEMNSLLSQLAPDGIEIEEIEDEETESKISEDPDGEDDYSEDYESGDQEDGIEQDNEADTHQPDTNNLPTNRPEYAEFSIEVKVGETRTRVTAEIVEPDMQGLWEELGGTLGAIEDDVEDIVYNLQVCLFKSNEEARAFAKSRGWLGVT
jgi:hypothetical protein